MVVVAWMAPPLLPAVIGTFLAIGITGLVYRHLTLGWVAWLLMSGLSLEMTLSDLIGPEAFQITIAAVKGGEIGLVLLTMVRKGLAWDKFNPAQGFGAIAAMGMMAGIHPNLTAADMARSLLGSATPFLLFYCVPPAGWAVAMLRAVCFVPAVSVLLGLLLDLSGVRPLFVDSGGARLAALGHPAFLAGVCLPAIYATLLRWLGTGSPHAALLLGVNLTILVLTGARAPTAYALLVIAASLVLAPSTAIPRTRGLVMVAAGIFAVPILLVLGESFSSLRLFTVLGNEAGNLSGRELLWTAIEAAADQAPWFGWGLGAGNVIIPHDGQIAQLLRTWAAHNEYLRMRVEGGAIGLALLILLFVLWAAAHTRRLPPLERLVMRLVLLAFAAHAVTDNVLISTPACVFFAFTAAVFAEARLKVR